MDNTRLSFFVWVTFSWWVGIFCVRGFLGVGGSLVSMKKFPLATFGLPKKGKR